MTLPFQADPPAATNRESYSPMLARSKIAHPSEDLAFATTEIPYLQFPGLSANDQLAHAVYTRHGGVSEPPYHSLNVGYSTGDEADRVGINLRIVQQTLGARHIEEMTQVHGTRILIVNREKSASPEAGLPPADAMITNLTGVALMVKQADCQAVILFDPENKVIANVHCGWRGNTANLLAKVIDAMRASFGCAPAALRAAIGPSLGPCCAEFTSHETLFPGHFRHFMVKKNYFDLWEVSRWQLLQAGLRKDRIELASICTRCRTDLFFSYRGEGTTGRFATVVMLL
jgi:polyphenol oxidase